MKIGIDARMFGPKHSGLGRYVQQLIVHLENRNSENDYVVFLRKENWENYIPKNKKFKKVLADIPWYSIEEQVKLNSILSKENLDLMHFPHWNVPYFCPIPFVVTIHDLIMFHYKRPAATTKGPLVYKAKDLAHRIILKRVVKKAKHIFVTSEYTKQDIHKTLGVKNTKMSVTYQAPFRKNKESKENVLNKYNINKPFALYVGNAYPHKNLNRLIQAWKIVKEENVDHQLVLVGKESIFYKKIEKEILHDKSIIYTGFLSDEELENLYLHAEIFIHPSLYEGFALPQLEAMQRKIPVISSNRSCLPEILQDAAVYFDPEDVEGMAYIISKVLDDKDIQYDMRQKGLKVVEQYSWNKLAAQTEKLYKNAL